MPFYQAADQSLHQIEPAFAHMLPVGSVPISDEAAQAILDAVQPVPPSPAEQIEALERQYMLPRPVRDVLLGVMEKEAAGLGITPEQLRLVNSGYRKVKELDEQIAALRAQL